MNDKFLLLLIESCCGLHLRSIVAIPELSEAKAAHILEAVDFLHER